MVCMGSAKVHVWERNSFNDIWKWGLCTVDDVISLGPMLALGAL